jgi:hypothetical protein
MRDVTQAHTDKIAAAQLAVDGQVAHGKNPNCIGMLKVDSDRPISFGFSGGFWPTRFPLFQALRFAFASMTDSLVVDRSLIAPLQDAWPLSDRVVCSVRRQMRFATV